MYLLHFLTRMALANRRNDAQTVFISTYEAGYRSFSSSNESDVILRSHFGFIPRCSTEGAKGQELCQYPVI